MIVPEVHTSVIGRLFLGAMALFLISGMALQDASAVAGDVETPPAAETPAYISTTYLPETAGLLTQPPKLPSLVRECSSHDPDCDAWAAAGSGNRPPLFQLKSFPIPPVTSGISTEKYPQMDVLRC